MITAADTNRIFAVSDFHEMKKKVLNWVQPFSTFCFLDNHQYQFLPHSMECLLAAGVKRSVKAQAGIALDQLQQFSKDTHGWLFGHLAYDLKNETEQLVSAHPDRIQFPDLFFFEPEVIIRLSKNEISIEASDPEAVMQAIEKKGSEECAHRLQPIHINQRMKKDEYVAVIEKLRQHILRGDCYEINFCQEFFATDVVVDPFILYEKLSNLSPNPFSVLYRLNDKWLICASPERYLKKEDRRILSQPIKGTARRELSNVAKDIIAKEELQQSSKDRSENVMVVDLVRNDLARVCEEGSVKVDELYGVYSFPQVHQMISTVSGTLRPDVSFANIIRATFPMGSMTGAPKKRVMELIERYEQTRRGIFSGAVGYISPDGDFDFNVVIRSMMYNASARYLSFQAGSGITFYSDPEKEWEECLLKAEAIIRILNEAVS